MVSYSVLIIIAVSGFIGMLAGAGLENLMRAANTRISEENEVCNDLAQKVLDMQDIILELQAKKIAPVAPQLCLKEQVGTSTEEYGLNRDIQSYKGALTYKSPEIVAKSKFGSRITKGLIEGLQLVKSSNGYQLVSTETILCIIYRTYFWVSPVGDVTFRLDVETDVTSLQHATKMYNHIMETAVYEGIIDFPEVQ